MDLAQKELAERQAELCRVFGNATRILILWILADRELAVTDIANEVGTSLQNVSQHLAMLKAHEIVSPRRVGHTIYYRLSDHEWIKECPVLLKAPRPTLVEE